MRLTQYDLPVMIDDLIRRGHTYRQIVAAMGHGMASEATIRYWRSGGQPRMTPGLALLRVWQQVTGLSLECAPTLAYSPMRRATKCARMKPEDGLSDAVAALSRWPAMSAEAS